VNENIGFRTDGIELMQKRQQLTNCLHAIYHSDPIDFLHPYMASGIASAVLGRMVHSFPLKL
jgi:hypothetical protein